MKITRKQLKKIIAEQLTGDPAPTASKLLEEMVDGLERKLISEMRLDPEEVDAMLIDMMETVGSGIEELLVRLLEGGYSEDY